MNQRPWVGRLGLALAALVLLVSPRLGAEPTQTLEPLDAAWSFRAHSTNTWCFYRLDSIAARSIGRSLLSAAASFHGQSPSVSPNRDSPQSSSRPRAWPMMSMRRVSRQWVKAPSFRP